MIMIDTNILTALIYAFVGGALRFITINLFQKRDLNKLQDLKKAHSMFDKFETDFEKQFFENEWKEACFYIQSGIKTNSTSITKYIRLKDNLGLDYTWRHIRKAKRYLDLNDDDIKINLKCHDTIYYFIALIIFISGLLVTPFLFNSIFQQKIQDLSYNLSAALLCTLPAIIGYILVLSTEPVIIARNIKKRLNAKLTT